MQAIPGQALPPAALCKRSDPDDIIFDSTAELEDLTEIPGQERALEAFHFATGINVAGHNVYVLGNSGSGRHDFVRQFLEKTSSSRETAMDWCYVYNFDDPRQPRALSLPPGRSRELREDVEKVIADAQTGIPAAFESEDYQTQRESIVEDFKDAQESALREVELEAQRHDIGVLQTPSGIAFVPVSEGETLSPEDFTKLPQDKQEVFHQKIARLTRRLQNVMRLMPKKASEMRRKVQDLEREVAKLAVNSLVEELLEKYKDLPEVAAHLQRMQEDIVDNVALFLPAKEGSGASPQAEQGGSDGELVAIHRYAINVLVNRHGQKGAPLVFADKPSFNDLTGRIEYESQFGTLVTNFRLICAGALHQANGGYLVVDAEKLLSYPLAWEGLKRALKSRQLHIRSMAEDIGMPSTVSLDPEPIPLAVKVILVGERRYYYLLNQHDPEFSELFKVQADFEDEMARSKANVEHIARWLATTVRKENLRHISRSGIARLMEECSRRAGDSERLSSNIHYARDLVREAHYWAKQNGSELIGESEIQLAIDARVRRGSRVRDLMQEELIRETFLVETDGERVGQINGLAVMQLGELAFGRPQRITAAVTLGTGELVDIEREVKLGGPLHSKGVLILGGFLRSHYLTDRPLSLSASLVFEQSYGGVDGDSASAAEMCVLASALSQVPLKQSMAITGSIDQHGRIQAIGGVNEKIEGFFDICRKRGLRGDEAVLIPAANVKHLMLRQDVVDAVEAETFRVFAVNHVDQALGLLTDLPAGERNENGEFPEGSLNRKICDRLVEFAGLRQSFGKAQGGKGDAV
ncbi:MAG: ATP-binding protein [Xanthomonadales bacterium]|jgi:lon-related putative ATP-dependent protease|nr:ATP-binding protein [Xanthomonadales bacterium]